MSPNHRKKRVSVQSIAGSFAEDKDLARRIRQESVLPAMLAGEQVVLDFTGVSVATQSFVHAVISKALRIYGPDALALLEFKACSPAVKSVILTVVDYSLEDKEKTESGLK